MEIKSRVIEDFQLTEDGEVVVAFAEIGKVDREGDYTFPGAFPPGKALPISDFNHGSWPQRGGRPPTGKGVIEEVGDLEVFKGQFFMDTTHGRDAHGTVKGMKELQEWSYGYDVVEKAAPPTGIKARRGLKAINPHEVSPVLMGAGANTFTIGIKDINADLAFLENDEAIQTLLKDSPLAGLPFAEASARVLRDVEDFTTRASEIAEIRVKEGRAISTARMEELARHREHLVAGLAAIDSLIAGATPKVEVQDEENEAKMRSARVRSRLAVARFDLTSVAP